MESGILSTEIRPDKQTRRFISRFPSISRVVPVFAPLELRKVTNSGRSIGQKFPVPPLGRDSRMEMHDE